MGARSSLQTRKTNQWGGNKERDHTHRVVKGGRLGLRPRVTRSTAALLTSLKRKNIKLNRTLGQDCKHGLGLGLGLHADVYYKEKLKMLVRLASCV